MFEQFKIKVYFVNLKKGTEKRSGKVKWRSNRWWWHRVAHAWVYESAVMKQRADEIFKKDLGKQAYPRRVSFD